MLARATKFEALWQEGALELRESCGSERVWSSRGRGCQREDRDLSGHVAMRRVPTELVAARSARSRIQMIDPTPPFSQLSPTPDASQGKTVRGEDGGPWGAQ